jgi:two-component system, LytTR family, sensor kinase
MTRWLATLQDIVRSITPKQWGIVCKIWVAVAFMLIAYNITNNFLSYGLKNISVAYVCLQTLNVLWYCMCWALTFPVSLWIARVLSGLTRVDWPFVVFHAVICIVLVAVSGAARGIVIGAFYYHQYGLIKLADIGNYAITYAYTGFIFYIVSLMLGYTIEYHRLFRDNAVRAAKLETQLVQSQLETLKAQLHPHFLFNTMNAIVTLMRKGESTAAIKMITGLSDLLRQSLDTMAAQEVRLEDEVALLRKYLDIQQMRFGDRLRVVYDLPSDIRDLMVPNLILQPLAENAVRHGIGRETGPGTITVGGTVDDGRLRISLSDTGPGVDGDWRSKAGIGLSNTVARLEKLYGSDYSFDLRNATGAGAVAVLEIPARQSQPDREG